MSEERNTCIDCELFDSMVGNLYGVCLRDSYIDGEEDSYLQWMHPQAGACENFKGVEP